MYINDTQSQVSAIVLSAESKPYDFQGNTGVSHKIRLSVGGEIIVCKSTDEQVKELQKFIGEQVLVVIKIESRKEKSVFQVESVK